MKQIRLNNGKILKINSCIECPCAEWYGEEIYGKRGYFGWCHLTDDCYLTEEIYRIEKGIMSHCRLENHVEEVKAINCPDRVTLYDKEQPNCLYSDMNEPCCIDGINYRRCELTLRT